MTAVRHAILVGSAPLLLLLATSAASAATPITACGTVIKSPGSYLVTKNLVAKAGSKTPCITVDSSYVTLDLGGSTIDCGGQSIDGIDDTPGIGPHFGLIVRSGSIVRCHNGIFFFTSGAINVQSVAASGNAADGIVVGDGLVLGNVCNDNGTGINAALSTVLENTALGNVTNCTPQLRAPPCSTISPLRNGRRE